MADIINSQDELNDILIKRDDGAGGKVKNALLISAALLLIAVIAFLTSRMIDADRYAQTPENGAATPAATGGEKPKTVFEAPQPTASDPEQTRSAIDEIIARHREALQSESASSAATTTPPIAPQPPQTTPPATQATVTPPATPTQPPKTTTPSVTPPITPQPPKTTATTQPPKAQSGLFYVQIESLAKAPAPAYLRVLRERGLSIAVREKSVNGKEMHRIYVGPYQSREQALATLPAIRRDYSPDAFIVQE
ncbi:MAG: SPOR domain-containing protein [Helicobacteraceae bacterium]|jgi:cell division septation protein DedD|nr:SPOR domain-containing protein [Helicobacteraceae bacterium]